MTRRRPAVAITADLSIWVGNTSDVDFSCEPGELIGFGTGGFEEKIIGGDLLSVCFLVIFWNVLVSSPLSLWSTLGDPYAEKEVVPWRLRKDLDLVYYERQLLPLCQVLRKLAIEKGIAEIEIEDHVLKNRMHEVFCTKS